ncbi:MAG: hypothetical protein PHC29_03410 [Candidatus Omnitrophica bacterium]|nr:hypothetical protein [Candidatus Omnitrophota bacterium]
MSHLGTKRSKILVGLIILFMLFQVYNFFKAHIVTVGLPKGKIVFCSGLRGDNEVYLMNLNGTGLQRLTEYSFFGPTFNTWISDFRSSFSHNGNRIIFESDRDDKNSRKKTIFDYKGEPIGWEHVSRLSDVYSMDINGEHQTRLTYSSIGSGLLFFSFNDQKILFHSDPLPEYPLYEELKIINSDGSNEITLAKGWGISQLARFSPDSQKVFFVLRGDLHVVDIYKGTLTRLTHFNTSDIDRPDKVEGLRFIDNFALSPNGDKITLVTTERNAFRFVFYSMDVGGAGMTQINILDNPDQHGYLGYIAEMKYSPDGKKITFIGHFKNRPFYILDENNDLNFVRDFYGIDSGIEDIEHDLFVFTPDSKQILFVATFPYGPFNDWFTWIKSVGYEVFSKFKYFITKTISGTYDNKYLCIMDIKTGKLKKIARILISSDLGRDFIHWEK